MHCREVRSRLGAYVDGEVRPDERTELERHLERCGACRQELEALQAVRSFLACESLPGLPSGFHSKVMLAAEQVVGDEAPSPLRTPLDLPRWWRAGTLATRAAAVAALVLGVWLGALLGLGVARQGSAISPDPSVATADAFSSTYGFDYMGESPAGSLSQVYVALASELSREVE